MIQLNGFRVDETVYKGFYTNIYRGQRLKDSLPVILKVLKEGHLGSLEIARLRSEYEIANCLNSLNIIKAYELVINKEHGYLILEDFGGSDIARQKQLKQLDIPEFLNLALKICNGLIEIHSKNIIHKDIKPENIIYNLDTKELKLADFGIASRLSREIQEITNPEKLEGSIFYISPEQTGRMNRSIDYRSDFYSLGITFYELLSGKVPFESDDLLECIHSHIAKIPPPLTKHRKDIPEILCDIILKLISKNAEDRYQSAFGIKYDLEYCLKKWNENQSIEPFELAKQEMTEKLYLPQRLYGRENEIKYLYDGFNKVCEGSNVLTLVAGYSGVGKTALINEMYKPITQTKGYFISGKFDQYMKNIPYSAILSAFTELLTKILSQSNENLLHWKAKILSAVGQNGSVIIDVIPELEHIIGKQTDVQDLGPAETQNRFNHVFQSFIKVFTQKNHPVTLFLDDLQWVDSASLKLIDSLIRSIDTNYLYIIGSFRDNEVDESHILQKFMDNLNKSEIPYNRLNLKPLNLNNVNELLSDAMSCNVNHSMGLAVLVYSKTQGNPFFLNEFVLNLYFKKLLHFSLSDQKWEWNLPDIEKEKLTDNVVELMTEKIYQLDEQCQNLLSIASCLGNTFALRNLALINELSLIETLNKLWPGILKDLIVPDQSVNHLILTEENNAHAIKALNKVEFSFLHDRVQESANRILLDQEKSAIHYKIGKSYLHNFSVEDINENLFDIISHLNKSVDHIETDKEKRELVELNFRAGKKARSSTAYISAVNFFTTAIDLFGDLGWHEDYDLTYNLYLNCSETMYLSGDIEESKSLIEIGLEHSKDNVGKAKFYLVLMQLYALEGNYLGTINTQQTALKLFGFEFPDIRNTEKILEVFKIQFAKYRKKLKGKTIKDLVNLPVMKDKEIEMAVNIIVTGMDSMYFATPELFQLTTNLAMTLFLDYGHTKTSAVLYGLGGEILFSSLGEYQLAYQYGELAVEVDSMFENALRSKTLCGYATFAYHWGKPLKDVAPILEKAIHEGVENGEHLYSGYAVTVKIRVLITVGHIHLDEIVDMGLKDIFFLKKIKQEPIVILHQLVLQFLYSLRGETESPTSFSNKDFDELVYLRMMDQQKFYLYRALYHFYRLFNFCYYERYEDALSEAEQLDKYVMFMAGLIHVVEHKFLESIAISALYDGSDEDLLSRLYKNRKKLKAWADSSPFSFSHFYHIVEAEIARVEKNSVNAEELYDSAIKVCQDFGASQFEGLAYELYAKYLFQENKPNKAKKYIKNARNSFYNWGAFSKVKDIEEKYHDVFKENAEHDRQNITTTYSKTIISSKGELDLLTVIKASQTISSEIELENIIHNLLALLMEMAGARKVYLILESNDKLMIKAELNLNFDQTKILKSASLDSNHNLSKAVVNYVYRTKETVVLNNAAEEGSFTETAYIQKHKPKSILCSSLLKQDKLIGIIYLENEISQSTFTRDRVELVKLISSQAAISIENAQLIEELKEKERLKQELAIAQKIQTAILPSPPDHQDFEISAEMRTAEEVGGDYYDIVYDRHKRLWFVIGDVSGHGLTPGLIMMMAESSFITGVNYDENIQSPKKVLNSINNTLYVNINSRLNDKQFMTLNVLVYEGDGKFTFAGKHEEIIIYRNKEKKFERIKTEGLFLGLRADISSSIKEKSFILDIDDLLILFTDGIIEAKNEVNKLFGMDQLLKIIEQNNTSPVKEIKDKVFMETLLWNNNKLIDDLSIIVIRRKQ